MAMPGRFPRVVVDNKVTPFVLRIALGGLFIYASVDKILYPAEFAEAVWNYQILPLELVNVFAIVLPWVELIAGLMLLNGFRTQTANGLIFLLVCMFTVSAVLAMIRGIDIECGCFSTEGGREVGTEMLLEEGIYMLMSLCIFVFDRGFASIDGLLSRYRKGPAWQAAVERA
jgi:uncharacterized membrane protein YphA (DoxX/SURF4 family)